MAPGLLMHNFISIPQGSIKSFPTPMPCLQAPAFQVHKVRLKGFIGVSSTSLAAISIPQGSIKSVSFHGSPCYIVVISIPQGSIKRPISGPNRRPPSSISIPQGSIKRQQGC